MAKTSIFDRAAQVAESGTSKQCDEVFAELEALATAEAAELAAVAPRRNVHGGDGRVYRTLPAGERFEAAALADDQEAVAECIATFERLTTRAEKMAALKQLITKRRAAVAADEAVTAAPREAKKAIAAIEKLVGEHTAAIEQLNAVHADLEAAVDQLVAARQANGKAPTVSLELFRAAGVALSYQLPTRRQFEETYGGTRPRRIIEPLFGFPRAAIEKAKVLVDVPKTLPGRIRSIMSQRDPGGRGLDAGWSPDLSDRAVQSRLADWYAEIIRRLEAGDVDAAASLGPPRYKKGRAVFDEAAA